jgi:hypothetical protein
VRRDAVSGSETGVCACGLSLLVCAAGGAAALRSAVA